MNAEQKSEQYDKLLRKLDKLIDGDEVDQHVAINAILTKAAIIIIETDNPVDIAAEAAHSLLTIVGWEARKRLRK